MASVRKVNRPKPWVVEWWVAGERVSQAFKRKTDADAFKSHIEDQARNHGVSVDPRKGRILLSEWADTWLAIVRADLKPKTVSSYESLLRSRILPRFGNRPLGSLKPEDVDAWIADMKEEGLSASRIRQAFVVLHAMLERAVRHGRVPRNVALSDELPPIRRHEVEYLDPATVDRIVAAMPEPYGLFVALQGVCGLRFGEAVALRRSSVDVLHRRLEVKESATEVDGRLVFTSTKSHLSRKVPLPPSLLAQLEDHLEHRVGKDADALLFTSPHGAPLRYQNFMARIWRPALASVGLPRLGAHVLRHSAVAGMIRAGWNPTAISKTAGHASVAFTLTTYGHVFDDDLDDLAAALESSQRRTSGVQALERG